MPKPRNKKKSFRKKKELESRKRKIKTASFGEQRISDFKKSKLKSKKVRDWYIIKDFSDITFKRKGYSLNTGSLLFYKDNIVYRYLPKEQYKNWEKLYNKNLPVEPIIGKASSKEINSLNKVLKENKKKDFFKELDKLSLKSKKDFVLIKSKDSGLSYNLHSAHSNRPVLTMEYLIKHNLRSKFSSSQVKSIGRQILKTIVSVWEEGIFHSHPHMGNWSIKFEKGYPKVRLIDFDESINMKRLDVYDSALSAACDISCIVSSLRSFSFSRSKSKKYMQFLQRKISEIYPKFFKKDADYEYKNKFFKIYLNAFTKKVIEEQNIL